MVWRGRRRRGRPYGGVDHGDGSLIYLSNLSVAGSGVERKKEMRKDIMGGRS